MKCEIEIDLGVIADEWEPVAFREGRVGEFAHSYDGQIHQLSAATQAKYMILRRKWKWPAWLTAEWIFLSPNGRWFATDKDPVSRTASWECLGVIACLTSGMFEFSPPPCDDWKTSKRRNPNMSK